MGEERCEKQQVQASWSIKFQGLPGSNRFLECPSVSTSSLHTEAETACSWSSLRGDVGGLFELADCFPTSNGKRVTFGFRSSIDMHNEGARSADEQVHEHAWALSQKAIIALWRNGGAAVKPKSSKRSGTGGLLPFTTSFQKVMGLVCEVQETATSRGNCCQANLLRQPFASMSTSAVAAQGEDAPSSTMGESAMLPDVVASEKKQWQEGAQVKEWGQRLIALLLSQQPVVPVQLSSLEPAKGDTLAILVSLPPPKNFFDIMMHEIRLKLKQGQLVEVVCDGVPIPAYPTALDAHSWRALVPTTPLHKAGPMLVKVSVHDGWHRPFVASVSLQEREFPVESIWLSEDKAGLSCTEVESDALAEFRATRTPSQLWCGALLRPNEGPVTTDYGLQRYYNGVFAQGYFHRGVDYAAEVGAPVVAPADARVALVGREAEGFALHGNCVGLDHGHGVLSLALHLNSIAVEQGSIVKAGQVVGTVGDTGIATGPHLHWGLYVNGECVDPQPWMKPQPWS